ncbi:hypothetical protein BKA67DRAFT_648950 [Truncatella angustata]|uniref:Uncharacterized protein n=1 Tax=Truncatella angustata TaxID=152316 RepID=A0A9P8ZUB1_9PEZI|nr:uncharacterized protein BKA67DRAFT_648950 [Truncatella angustata]KAH6649011.1 hypothetical protein BKA67DRAFT_648950 [Truncatella angustata]
MHLWGSRDLGLKITSHAGLGSGRTSEYELRSGQRGPNHVQKTAFSFSFGAVRTYGGLHQKPSPLGGRGRIRTFHLDEIAPCAFDPLAIAHACLQGLCVRSCLEDSIDFRNCSGSVPIDMGSMVFKIVFFRRGPAGNSTRQHSGINIFVEEALLGLDSRFDKWDLAAKNVDGKIDYRLC